MTALPLQALDSFLLPYDAWQPAVLLFALVMVASLPLRSRQVLALNTLVFGLLFAIFPTEMGTIYVRFLGLALLLVAPLLYATADS